MSNNIPNIVSYNVYDYLRDENGRIRYDEQGRWMIDKDSKTTISYIPLPQFCDKYRIVENTQTEI